MSRCVCLGLHLNLWVPQKSRSAIWAILIFLLFFKSPDTYPLPKHIRRCRSVPVASVEAKQETGIMTCNIGLFILGGVLEGRVDPTGCLDLMFILTPVKRGKIMHVQMRLLITSHDIWILMWLFCVNSVSADWDMVTDAPSAHTAGLIHHSACHHNAKQIMAY